MDIRGRLPLVPFITRGGARGGGEQECRRSRQRCRAPAGLQRATGEPPLHEAPIAVLNIVDISMQLTEKYLIPVPSNRQCTTYSMHIGRFSFLLLTPIHCEVSNSPDRFTFDWRQEEPDVAPDVRYNRARGRQSLL